MSPVAELYDGTELEFPDNTPPEIIQQTAKRLTLQKQSSKGPGVDIAASRGGLSLEQLGAIPPGQGISRYNQLLGGENAKISSAPGLWENFMQAVTAPFHQEAPPVAADQPRPTPLQSGLQKGAAVGKGILDLLNVPFNTIAPTVTKYAGENLPIDPRTAEAMGNAAGVVAQGAILPWRSRTPLTPARTIDDLIAAPSPGLPPPPERPALPAPVRPQLTPPEMVTQVTPEGVASQAPKRTIVDLVDEVKQDVKQKVIDEIFQELKTGRTAAMPRKPAPEVPLQIEPPRTQIEPPKHGVIYEGAPEGLTPAPWRPVPRQAIKNERGQVLEAMKGQEPPPVEAPPVAPVAPRAPRQTKSDVITAMQGIEQEKDPGSLLTIAIDSKMTRAQQRAAAERLNDIGAPEIGAAMRTMDPGELDKVARSGLFSQQVRAQAKGNAAGIRSKIMEAEPEIAMTKEAAPSDYLAKLPNQPYPERTAAQKAKDEASINLQTEQRYRFATPEVQRQHGINPKTGRIEAPQSVPESALSPEELAAQGEMRGMLGGKPTAQKNYGFTDIQEQARKTAREEYKQITGQETVARKLKEGPGQPYSKTRQEWDAAYKDEIAKLTNEQSAVKPPPEIPSPAPLSAAEADLEAPLGRPPPRNRGYGDTEGHAQDLVDQMHARQAREAATEAPGTVSDILKSEKGQIGSTEVNPIVTKARLAVGEAVEQSGKTVRKTMSEPGNELIDRLSNVRNDAETMTGINGHDIEQALKKLKKPEYENAVMAAQGLEAPKSEAAAEFAQAWRTAANDVGQRAKEAKLQIKNPVTGEWRPFTMRENYFPHYSKQELETILQDPRKEERIRQIIRDQLGKTGREVSERDVQQALQGMIRAGRGREGHLEISRVINFPDYVKDPRVAMKYLDDANRRIAVAQNFGPKLERSEDIFTAIRNKHGPAAEEFARTLFNREIGLEHVPDKLAYQIMAAARDYNAFTKLGRAFIPNMSQHTYTAIVAGNQNTLNAAARSFTKEGIDFAERSGVINRESLRQLYQEAFGTGDSWLQKAIGIELKPFSWTEKGNRIVAANAGRYYALETFDALKSATGKKAQQLADTLRKMNVDVDGALARGALSDMDELKAAQNIVNRTQFKVDPMELPLFWSSPEGKVVTQFKPFSFKAGQFMKDEILKELAHGNVGPAARSTIMIPAGHAVKIVQNLLSGKPGLATTAEAIGAVGALGLFGDLLGMGGRTDATSTVVGPSATTAIKGLSAGWQTKNRLSPDYTGNEPTWGPLAKFAAGETPIIGQTLSTLLKKQPSERQKMLDELGLKDTDTERRQQRKKMLKDLGLNQ